MKLIFFRISIDIVGYNCVLYYAWHNAHWSIAALLSLFCLRAFLDDFINAVKQYDKNIALDDYRERCRKGGA